MLDFRAETSQPAGRSITVLGATGSIGQSTFDVIRRSGGRFRVFGMAARAQHEALGPLVQEFKPRLVVLFEEDAALQLRRALGPGHSTQVMQGMNGLIEAVTAAEVDHVVCGIGGAVGLQPLWSALAAGKVVSIANKEPLVLAGALLMRVAQKHQACILPLDSEHHAIFRCLQGQLSETVRRVVLTASGGAFRDWPLDRFPSIQPADALKHPTWTMGAKITVDSATMMNKGLEIIEAHHLFGLPQEQIEVCIHRQSAVHGMVEFDDGTWLAQMAAADMRVPIRHCLEHPRLEHPRRGGFDLPAWDPVVAGRLDFEAVDARRYPCLALARRALALGAAAPAVLNGANEAAVSAFLENRLPYLGISSALEGVLDRWEAARYDPRTPTFLCRVPESVEDALAANDWGQEALRQGVEAPAAVAVPSSSTVGRR